MNRINASFLVKKVFCKAKLLFNLFMLLTFFLMSSGCSSSSKQPSPTKKYNLTEEERIWLREFFNELLFETSGAFVLYGTKPMSISGFQKALTPEEIAQGIAWHEALTPKERVKYSKIKTYDFYEHFLKWQKIKDRFPITQYLFVTVPNRFDPKENDFFFFVNIEMTLRTLLTFYGDFKRIIGKDFDPLEVVFELENRESEFWKKAFRSDALLGMLLGFGRDNSWFFDWMRYGNEKTKMGAFLRALPKRGVGIQDIVDINSQQFEMPVFVSYGLYPDDKEIIARYTQEQKLIKKLYRQNDPVDIALEWLTR